MAHSSSATFASPYYASSLVDLQRFEEAGSVLRKMIPVARRVLGESHINTVQMKKTYAQSIYRDDGATLDDLREAVTTLEETERTARRVLGGAHPFVLSTEESLRASRQTLRGREAGKSVVFLKCSS